MFLNPWVHHHEGNIKYQIDIRWVSQNTTLYKVLCFDLPTLYQFDIWYCNRTQRGWTT